MKMIKRSWMILTVLFMFLLSCPAVLHAAQEDAAGRYDAAECRQGEDSYDCEGEYILLNADGTGEIQFNGTVYSLEWTLDGNNLSLTDEDDYTSTGTLKDGVIEASIYDYDYVYQLSESASADAAAASNGDDAEAKTQDADSSDGEDSSDQSAANSGLLQNIGNIQPGSQEGPVLYAVVTRDDVGGSGEKEDSDAWYLDYIALNDDGTGVFLFNKAAFSITWKQNQDTFSFTDHLDNQFTGTKTDSVIKGQYGRYRYTFERTYETLPAYNLAPDKWGKGLDPVTDQAEVLSEDDLAKLTEKAQELTEEYDVGIYVVLVDSRDRYTWSKNIETLGEEFQAGYSLGVGYTEKKKKHESADVNPQWKDCILMTVAFDVRKYDVRVTGEYMKWALSEYAQESITDSFVGDFKENNWKSGLYDYMDTLEKVLKVSAKGKQYGFQSTTKGFWIGILVPIALALLFGYGIAAIMRSSMQNTQKAKNAAAYIAGDQIEFTRREDRYIRTLVSRVYSPREKKSSGGGGGGSSSGGSHMSGSF